MTSTRGRGWKGDDGDRAGFRHPTPGGRPPTPGGAVTGRTVDPTLRSWVPVPAGSDFPIQNLPFGVFEDERGRRVGVAIGEHVLDLRAVHDAGIIRLEADEAAAVSLNPMLGSRARLGAIRHRASELLTEGNEELFGIPGRGIVPLEQVTLQLPLEVPDYVDFYSSLHHATNLGRMFRPDAEPLPPNWRHLPVGYHGRSATIVLSSTDVRRPWGQHTPPAGDPVFGPSTRLDFELEVGFVTCGDVPAGRPIPVDRAEEHIAGLVLVNDWSARDIQAWEYVPLGPFLGKSFATTISPWLVTLDALAPYRVPAPPQHPEPLPHLRADPNLGLDLELEVDLNATTIARTTFRDMYWTMSQQLAHVSSNGAVVRAGDLYASGTVSGPDQGTFGSLIELAEDGARPLRLGDGSERAFLEDGDTVTMRGFCDDGRVRIGFGANVGTIVPAPDERG